MFNHDAQALFPSRQHKRQPLGIVDFSKCVGDRKSASFTNAKLPANS